MACPIIFPRKTNISTWAGDVAPGLGTYRSRPTPAAWTPFGVRISSGSAVDCTKEGKRKTYRRGGERLAGKRGRAEQPIEEREQQRERRKER